MGAYRFLLASFVIASHYFSESLSLNPGPYAVYSFMVISGFVMTQLISKYYSNTEQVWGFYLDRALRILPQFVLYLVLTYAFVISISGGYQPLPGVSFEGCSLQMLGLNVLTLFNFLIGIPVGDCLLLPQAWSLGLETAFYVIIPLLITNVGRQGFWLIVAISLTVFAKSMFGQIDFNEWAYFNIPGTLFMFLLGVILAREVGRSREQSSRQLWAFLSLLVIGATCCLATIDQHGYNHEALLAIASAPLFIAMLTRMGPSQTDNFFGDLSYGIFLNHVLVIYIAEALMAYFGMKSQRDLLGFLWIIVVSSCLATISYTVVEKPFIKLRRSGRNVRLQKPDQKHM